MKASDFFYHFKDKHPTLTRRLVLPGFFALWLWVALVIYLYYLAFSLPPLDKLEKPQYDLPTQVFDRHDRLVTEFYTQRRILLPFERVPKRMIEALLAIEDSRFYYHFGVDPVRILKALVVDIVSLDFAQGASTLTQQTAKMFLLSTEKKIDRKLQEALLAIQMEARFSKDEILELYLNKTYFGHGAYGLEAAAQGYFSKSAADLNLQEVALLAGLPQAPSRWAPTTNLDAATRRRNLVLQMMAAEGFISPEEMKEAIASPIRLRLGSTSDNNEASYYSEQIRQMVMAEFGMEQLYQGGLKVYTEMDLDYQIAAQQALQRGLEELDKRQGFRGPQGNLWAEVAQALDLPLYQPLSGFQPQALAQLPKEQRTRAQAIYNNKIKEVTSSNHLILGAKVTGVVHKISLSEAQLHLGQVEGRLQLAGLEWARPTNNKSLKAGGPLRDLRNILHEGDVIELTVEDYDAATEQFRLSLFQKPAVNGALFSMEPKTGAVRALSGGYDFSESEFNRAMQSRRQPGSSFKPIVYSLALEEGYTRTTWLDDTPLVFKDTDLKPANYSKKYKGRMPLKSALIFSKNIPTVRLTIALTPTKIIEHARNLGMSADLPNDLTIGLGTGGVTLEEMVRTYSIFANGGKLLQPRFIRRIESRHGKLIRKAPPLETKTVLTTEAAFLLTATLRDGVSYGTGVRARALGRPAAGKTGTTNNYTDAWFMGFVPQLMTGVYVGFDDVQKTLGEGETGSRAALPVWLAYMQEAVSGSPIAPFEQPAGIQVVKVVPETGMLDCDGHPKAYFEYYAPGTAPANCHQPDPLFPDIDYLQDVDDEAPHDEAAAETLGDPSQAPLDAAPDQPAPAKAEVYQEEL